jgi:hypothetical protein
MRWLLLLAMMPAAARAQDTIIVELVLVGAARQTVEAFLASDSTLHLPSREVAAFLDTPMPPVPWITLTDLAAAYPPVRFTWRPRELRVVVDDPQRVLPASRSFYAGVERRARGALPLASLRSGPFLAFAADDSARSLVDVGYSWRGRVALTARQSSTTGTAWALSIAPVPAFYVAITHQQSTRVSARLATGPVWIAPTYADGHADVDALVAVDGVTLFASTRDVWLLTIRGRAGDLQLGRSRGVTAARVSWGPLVPSPFSFPTTR